MPNTFDISNLYYVVRYDVLKGAGNNGYALGRLEKKQGTEVFQIYQFDLSTKNLGISIALRMDPNRSAGVMGDASFSFDCTGAVPEIASIGNDAVCRLKPLSEKEKEQVIASLKKTLAGK